MFALVYILLFILGTYVIYKVKGTIRSVAFVFLIMWTIWPMLTVFGIFGLNKPELKVHLLIVSSIVCFIIGFLLVKGEKTPQIKVNQQNEEKIHIKPLIILNILSYLIIVPYTIKAIKIINTFGFSYLRHISTINSPELIDNTISHVIIYLFIVSLYTANILLLIAQLIKTKKLNYKLLILSVVGALLVSFTFAARATLVKYLVYFGIGLFVIKDFYKTIIEKKVLLFSLLGVLIITIIITTQRLASNMNVIGNIVLYYSGSVNLLEYYMENPSFSLMGVKNFYGTISLGFIYNNIPNVTYVLFKTPYFGSDSAITSITAIPINVNHNLSLNAIPTTIYYFVMDFGYFGSQVLFFIFGFVMALIERKTYKNQSIRMYAIYLFLAYIVFKSIQNYDLLFPASFFVLFYIIIFTIDFRKGVNIEKKII
jgi:oligosaccharide repeat unit polymerase